MNYSEAFDTVRKLTSSKYSYEIGKDGSVWLMSPDFTSCMWPDMRSFLFGNGKQFSIFDFVDFTLNSTYAEERIEGIGAFCSANKWMRYMSGCGSVEELALKLTALNPV